MNDPIATFHRLAEQTELWLRDRLDRQAPGAEKEAAALLAELERRLTLLRSMPDDPERLRWEPDDLAAIRALRPATDHAPRPLNAAQLASRMAGALNGRFAGCTLGAIVEMNSVADMEAHAAYDRMAFPPEDYWLTASSPSWRLRYISGVPETYTRDRMHGVPVDDDIAYTQLGLLILEECGRDFTTADVGRMWRKYLPMAYTAEEVTLRHLQEGLPPELAGRTDNPYREWIGADIRSDPWGYAAAGNPELAAEWAYRDATLSHRWNGVYGAMYFSAAVAAAFTVDHPRDALEIALGEIPAECAMAETVRWALDRGKGIHHYREARAAVEERFGEMSCVHTLNNAALTIFGLLIGGRDFTRVIGETVAMGMDNDCTAATAGSIAGAVIGIDNIPAQWTRNFDDVVYSYLNGVERFSIQDLTHRFLRFARGNAEGEGQR